MFDFIEPIVEGTHCFGAMRARYLKLKMAERYLRATCGVGTATPQLQKQLLDRGPRVASDVWVRVVDLTTKLAASHTVGNTKVNMHFHLCKLNARIVRLCYKKRNASSCCKHSDDFQTYFKGHRARCKADGPGRKWPSETQPSRATSFR